MAKKCRILHLPSASYLYYRTDDNTDYTLYTEFEVIEKDLRMTSSTVFESLKAARVRLGYSITHICFDFGEDNHRWDELRKEHCEIMEVVDG